LGLSTKRDGLLYVPKNYQASRPAPLVVMLHGAGGDARGGLTPFQNLADATGLILLAPASRRQTWDVLVGGYGPDIALIDQALAQTFSRYAVDPTRIAIEGFSDGASYALSVQWRLVQPCDSVLAGVYGTSFTGWQTASVHLARHARLCFTDRSL
jgi:poly(3-hydroxybutyrate) depolymerase